MRAEGLAPSAVTYGCLLAACERTGDVSRAFQLYQQACAEVGVSAAAQCDVGVTGVSSLCAGAVFCLFCYLLASWRRRLHCLVYAASSIFFLTSLWFFLSSPQGVEPSDQMHDMLISMCTEAQRLEEAVDLVKRLARQPRALPTHLGAAPAVGSAAAGAAGGASASGNQVSHLQDHTLNSLIRALCGKYVDRALRLLSLCRTMGMRPSRRTYLSLIAGCAKASRSAVAYDLYRSRESDGGVSKVQSNSWQVPALFW
jgi:pentatricopeptide repeat protein